MKTLTLYVKMICLAILLILSWVALTFLVLGLYTLFISYTQMETL